MNGENILPLPVRVRFAPSPTGTLHIGSARTALYNFLFARHLGGSFVLRIEDTDVARSTPEFEASIIGDLAWLGLDWDEGPETGGDFGPYRQSERVAAGIYHREADRLLAEGKAYRCFCPPERLEQLKAGCLARGEMPKYDRACAALTPEEAEARAAAGEPATIRFRVPDAGEVIVRDIIHGPTVFSTGVLGDFIIIRSDGGVSYNFAVVVDDIDMAITHVIRGEDHLTNTARQLLVFEALGQEPPRYAHHSLIMGPDGGKLSKRHGATSVGDFRRTGYLPSAIINYLALLSWSPGEGREKMSREEMETQFELSRVSRSPAIFDIQKLNWLNGLHLRDLDPDALHEAVKDFTGEVPDAAAGQLAVAEAAVQTSLVTLSDAGPLIHEFFAAAPLDKSEGAGELTDPEALAVLDLAIIKATRLDDAAEYNVAAVAGVLEASRCWMAEFKGECRQKGIPPKRMYRTLRIALTGRTSGPELPFLLAGLGRENIRRRLEAAKEFAEARI